MFWTSKFQTIRYQCTGRISLNQNGEGRIMDQHSTIFFPLFFFFFNLVFVLIWIICRALGLKINLTLFNLSSMFRPSSGSKLQNQLSCNFKLVYILTLISDRGIPWGPTTGFFFFFFFFFAYFATVAQEFLKRVQFSVFWWKKYPCKRVLKGDNPTPVSHITWQ